MASNEACVSSQPSAGPTASGRVVFAATSRPLSCTQSVLGTLSFSLGQLLLA